MIASKSPSGRSHRLFQPEALFGHIFGEDTGFLVTFTAHQARFRRPDARHNELADTRQRSWSYPDEAERAAKYLIAQAQEGRDAYFGVHLFRASGSRLATNAAPTLRSLWLDEDEGAYPEIGPQPTAVVASSAKRRHLYWRLTRAVAVEWAVTMNRRLARWAGGDCGKAGLASVLRVPGTGNYKRHPQVDPVTMEITEARIWEPQVLEQAIPPLPSEAGATHKRSDKKPYDGPRLELLDFLEDAAVEVVAEVPDELGVKLTVICPWVGEHSGGDLTGTYAGQLANGALWFHCHHAHCFGRRWPEFRRRVRRLNKKRQWIGQGKDDWG
jgi:RepB DNA-primase from phage plasmid